MAYAILVFSAILVEFAVNLPTGSLPLALSADGVGPTGISTVATVAALAPLAGSIPVGGLVDRFGRILTVRIAAIVAAAALLALSYVLPKRHDVRVKRSRRIFMRSAWLPAMTFLVGATMVGGVNTALAVITLHQRGISNAALLFTATAVTTFILRYPAGRLVDRFGPRAVAVPTAVFHFAGAALAARAHSDAIVVLAGCCSGFAWSAMVPVGIGLLFERSSRNTRGAAMGAYNMAFALGMLGGASLATVSSALGLGYAPAVVVAGAGPALALPWVFLHRTGRVRG